MGMYVEVLKYIIKEFHERGLPEDLVDRDIQLKDYLIPNVAKVIVGPRRAGKTYLMYQIMKNLKQPIENYVYLDFEDGRILGITLKDMEDILEAYFSLYPEKKPIFFLDEVHNVLGWESFVRRLLNAGYEVFLTGSNAKLLSKEYATKLAGRMIEITLLPLSFKEFLRFKGVSYDDHVLYSKKRYKVIEYMKEYLFYGGFPYLERLQPRTKEVVLRTYYNTTILRDIVARYKVTEWHLLDLFVKKLAENVTNPFSFNSITKQLAKLGINTNVKTLSLYYNYLVDAFLLIHSELKRDSFVKKQMERKVYFVDNGYLSLFYTKENLSKRLENAVAVELYRCFGHLTYLRNGGEIDFLVKWPIQVTWELTDENREREITPLLKYMEKSKVKEAYIITAYQKEMLSFGRRKIYVLPFWHVALFGFTWK